MTTRQVAESLGVSQRTVRRLIVRGELRAVRVGGSVRFQREALDGYIATSVLPGHKEKAEEPGSLPAPLEGQAYGARRDPT